MENKKLPVRKKGRAETVIEDLNRHGLLLVGIADKGGSETLIPINADNPYKDCGVFRECDCYRVFTSDGRPVIDKRHLSGLRKWIDSGEIDCAEEIAQKRDFDQKLRDYLKFISG